MRVLITGLAACRMELRAGARLPHGCNPLDPQDAVADADGDGQSNLAEFLAGTNPTNQFSVFKVISAETLTLNPSPIGLEREVRLRWSSESNQFYAVEQSQDLFAPFTLIATSLRATPPVNTFTNTAPGDASRFYRLRFQPWPTHLP